MPMDLKRVKTSKLVPIIFDLLLQGKSEVVGGDKGVRGFTG